MVKNWAHTRGTFLLISSAPIKNVLGKDDRLFAHKNGHQLRVEIAVTSDIKYDVNSS